MEKSVLFVGDIHIQVSNIQDVNILIKSLINIVDTNNLDFVVLGGDILHTHERLHTLPMNKAYELIEELSSRINTYILVGNHDATSNQIFLTDSHWMNALKKWKGVTIVDTVVKHDDFLFVPYVPNGRFLEALETSQKDWKNSKCIFAHQEFKGCKMGGIISKDGDDWDLSYPYIVSGHIHSKQLPQDNIYYPGSSLQIAFGENEKTTVSILQFSNDVRTPACKELELGLVRKKIVYMDIHELETYTPKESNNDKIKLCIKGNVEEFKALKKTSKYKELSKTGLNIVFKPSCIPAVHADTRGNNEGTNMSNKTPDFFDILHTLVKDQNNPVLSDLLTTLLK